MTIRSRAWATGDGGDVTLGRAHACAETTAPSQRGSSLWGTGLSRVPGGRARQPRRRPLGLAHRHGACVRSAAASHRRGDLEPGAQTASALRPGGRTSWEKPSHTLPPVHSTGTLALPPTLVHACTHTPTYSGMLAHAHAHGSPQPRPGGRLGSVPDEARGLLSPALAVPGVPCGAPRGDNDPAGAHTCTFCRATFSLLLPP